MYASFLRRIETNWCLKVQPNNGVPSVLSNTRGPTEGALSILPSGTSRPFQRCPFGSSSSIPRPLKRFRLDVTKLPVDPNTDASSFFSKGAPSNGGLWRFKYCLWPFHWYPFGYLCGTTSDPPILPHLYISDGGRRRETYTRPIAGWLCVIR